MFTGRPGGIIKVPNRETSGETWRFGHQMLVAVLVTMQDLITLESMNAVKNCICGEKWWTMARLAPPSSAGPVSKNSKLTFAVDDHHGKVEPSLRSVI